MEAILESGLMVHESYGCRFKEANMPDVALQSIRIGAAKKKKPEAFHICVVFFPRIADLYLQEGH